MEEKTIPHEHHCTVCKRIEGCDEKYCKREVWDVCRQRAGAADCKKIYDAATVHVFTEGDILPCCGRSRLETPGDRMTTDPAKITCQGPPLQVLNDPPGEALLRDRTIPVARGIGLRVQEFGEKPPPVGKTFSTGPAVVDGYQYNGEPPAPITPGHVVGCLCAKCEPEQEQRDTILNG